LSVKKILRKSSVEELIGRLFGSIVGQCCHYPPLGHPALNTPKKPLFGNPEVPQKAPIWKSRSPIKSPYLEIQRSHKKPLFGNPEVP
jgi:hypothetical protein